MRGLLFLVAAVLVGVVQALAGPRCPWPEEARGAFLLVLAVEAAWRSAPGTALPFFWGAGLVQDFFLGRALGVSTLLYALAAIPFEMFRRANPNAGAPARWGFLFMLAAGTAILAPLWERLSAAPLLSEGVWIRGLGGAALSLAAAPLFGWALGRGQASEG